MADAAWPSWVQGLPQHWARKRLKHVCSRYADYGLNEPATSYVNEGVRFLRTSDIDDAGTLQAEGVYLPEELTAGSELQDGDILLSRSGTIGRSFRYRSAFHGRCSFAGYLIRYRPNADLDPDFAFYFTKSQPFSAWLSDSVIAATIGNVNGQKFANTPIGIPPREEQQGIVAFLDRETARIDALIGKKRRLLELLEEKRLAVITHAVTKGLDPNAPMKDSGIDWLGQIPAHWGVRHLKRSARTSRKSFTDGDWIETPYITDDGIRLIQTGNVGIGEYREQGFRYVSDETFESLSCTEVFPGDVLICRLDGPVGRACLAPQLGVRMITSVDNAILKADEAFDPRFIVYCLSSRSWLEWIGAVCRVGGGFRFRVSRTQLGEQALVVPPVAEQAAIADHIDGALSEMSRVAEKIEVAIKLLQEYRSALITSAVTGKIDVRGAMQRKEAAE